MNETQNFTSLSLDDIRAVAPSIFTTDKASHLTDK